MTFCSAGRGQSSVSSPQCRRSSPSPRGLTVSHILFAGHRGFRPIPENIDDHESTFSALRCKRQSHSFPKASGWAASAGQFDALRLCVFAFYRPRFQRRDAKAQRRREDLAKRRTATHPRRLPLSLSVKSASSVVNLNPDPHLNLQPLLEMGIRIKIMHTATSRERQA